MCRESKPLSLFGVKSGAKDGYTSMCKACKSRQRRESYAMNPRATLDANARSRQRNAEKINERKRAAYEAQKNDPDFKAKRKAYADSRKEEKREYDRRYRERTREQQKKWSREWAANNKDKVRAIRRTYKVKRRAVESEGIGTTELAAWAESAEKSCYWCGIQCDESYHIDHYEPLSRGGEHRVENLVISCPTCNMRKSCRDPYEFAQTNAGRLF